MKNLELMQSLENSKRVTTRTLSMNSTAGAERKKHRKQRKVPSVRCVFAKGFNGVRERGGTVIAH
jgi:hypothetical protein